MQYIISDHLGYNCTDIGDSPEWGRPYPWNYLIYSKIETNWCDSSIHWILLKVYRETFKECSCKKPKWRGPDKNSARDSRIWEEKSSLCKKMYINNQEFHY